MTEQLIYSTASSLRTFNRDGRTPIEELYARFDTLFQLHGWKRNILYAQTVVEPEHGARTCFPIVCYRTARAGPALYFLTGVHGEEPAGPVAAARNLDVFIELSRQGVPIVGFFQCNPGGYYRDWRYQNERRNWKIGKSVTEANHAMPHLDEPKRARFDEPATPEAWAIINHLIELNPLYPPVFWIDLHEDEAFGTGEIPLYQDYSAYCYSEGTYGYDDPIARKVTKIFTSSDLSIQQSGETRFGELIVNGLVKSADGEGSVDEFAARDDWISGGILHPKFPARSVIVTETPTIELVENGQGKCPVPIPIERRIAVQGDVIKLLPRFFQMTKQGFL